MTKFFLRLYDFFNKRKALLAAAIITVTAICVFFATKMHFSEDISQFLPENEQNEQVNYAFRHIGAANTILVYFSANDDSLTPSEVLPDAIESFVEDLSEMGISDYVSKIQYTVDETEIIGKMNFISRNLPYFLDEDDYRRIDTIISNENIARQLQNDKDIISTIHGSMMQTVVKNDPLFISGKLLKGLQEFKMNDNFELIDGYIFLKGGREAIVRVESKFPLSETANNKMLTRIIDETAAKTMQKNHDVSVKPFGAVYISICNADQIKRDSIITISIALTLIISVLVLSFRSKKVMLSLPLALAFGMIFSFGINAMVYNEVSLIAVGISSVIIGIAANYPLHMIDHINHGFGARRTISDIASPLTTGNITTVGAFLSLLFISSPAMKNLGLFAAMLLVGTILFVLVVMPHVISNQKGQDAPRHFLGKIADIHFEDCKPLVGGIIILTIVFLFTDKAGFDADMSKINYMTDDYRAMIGKLNEDTNDTDRAVYVVAEGKDIDEALERYESVRPKLHKIVSSSDSVRLSSIGGYVPSKERQTERLRMWKDFWKDRDIYPVIVEESRKTGFKDDVFSSFGAMMTADLKPQDHEYFSPLTTDMADNYMIKGDDRAMVFSILHVKPESFDDIKALAVNSLDKDDDGVFVFSQDSVLSQVVSSLSDDFDYVLYICGFIVFFFLCISFGRLELSIISFIPLVVSWVWILAIMHIFGIQFNIINIILATFIFGMGDDYTIFMTEGCIYEHRFGRKMLNTYKNTVALSALIMFIGIGSLIIARHPAMKQLGEIVIVGMVTVMLMAYTIPTLLFRWLTTKKGKPRRNPIRIKYLPHYLYSIAALIVEMTYMNILGLVVLVIGRKNDRHKLFFHKNIYYLFRFMTRYYPLSRTTVHNNTGEESPFDKPSVIICNHQSQIDLLTLALDPKIIVLTQKWVWNCPFYGWIVHLADYYCVEDIDYNDLTPLREMIDKGYSILIYPEGHRSADCKITRFHKGAFYIAQRLGVDIQPIIIHGYGYALPKHELTIKKSRLSIHIMPKVSPQQAEYQTICSDMHKYYVKKYDEICHEIEDADYYADEVLNNYIYKGKDVERSARKSLKDNDNYKKLIECIPESGEVELLGCGMGVAPLMAALVRKKTTIRAVIDNEDDYLTAVNCASVPDNLHYVLGSDGKACNLTLYCDGH